GGYDKLLDPLKKGLDIQLNTPVTTIEYEEGDGATVHAEDQKFESDFVICTVPLGVLKQNAINFVPSLPASYHESISKIAMGNVTKLALKFDEPHWPTDVQYFGLMSEKRGRWNYFLNYRVFSDENILLGLSVGSYAGVAEEMKHDEMVADCMKAVRTMFGKSVPNPVDSLATRWSKDRWTLGAYSYVNVGTKPADFNALSTPIAKTVLLAGEHTGFDYHGTTHGAYLSGLSAAETIDEKLSD
ncbi:MAG: flavin monoamine oxidase family protein, partial [Rhizobiaceae bacterium]